MSIPTSISLDHVAKNVAREEVSPRETTCQKLTQFLFDSPRKNPSVKIKKLQVKEETATPSKTSEKLQGAIEHSPLASAKIKKPNLERSKSLGHISFQENALYSPPQTQGTPRRSRKKIDSLPVCNDILLEPVINSEWLRRLEKCISQGILQIPFTYSELQNQWKLQIQKNIDHYYRENFGHSCLSEEILLNPPVVFPEKILRDAPTEEMLYEPYREVLKQTLLVLEEIVSKLYERTSLLDALVIFLNHAIHKVHTFPTFLSNLKKLSQHRELHRLLSRILIKDENPHVDMHRYFEPFMHEAQQIYDDYLREIKWFHDQARLITFKQSFKWSQTHDEPNSMKHIERPQIIRSITTYGKRVTDLMINDMEGENSLEGIIHQINLAGIDRSASGEVSSKQAKDFEMDKEIPCDGVLRLMSMGCWFHADQLMRKWFDELFEAPLHTKCKKGIASVVQINDPSFYTVRQIKTFCVYCRRIPNDPDCYTVIEPEIGEVRFQWQVSPDLNLGWKGELRIISWKIRADAPIHLKWLFIKALTHYHS